MSENEPHHRMMRPCPTCDGTGINPVLFTKLCPKCNGEKWVWARHPFART